MANLVLVVVNLIALPALLVFVVIINPSSHADAVFVSIDCGFTGSSTYKDENSSIVWYGPGTKLTFIISMSLKCSMSTIAATRQLIGPAL